MIVKYITPESLPELKEQKVGIFGAGPLGIELKEKYKNKDVLIFDDYYQSGESTAGVKTVPTCDFKAFSPEILFLATLKSRQRMINRIHELNFKGLVYIFEGEDDDIFAPYDFIKRPEISRYKNKHINEPAFIIGNGPSLNKTDPRLIKNAVTFAANAIYLMDGFKPDYHFCDDIYVAEQRAIEINSLDWVKFYPADQEKWLKNAHYFNGKRVPWITKFSKNFDKFIELNATVSYTMMQMAFFMGCNPVYLIGMDHDYSDLLNSSSQNGNLMISNSEDNSHFHKDYFAEGMKWHFPWIERIEAAFELALYSFQKAGKQILNATEGGKLEIFPRASFYKLIDKL